MLPAHKEKDNEIFFPRTKGRKRGHTWKKEIYGHPDYAKSCKAFRIRINNSGIVGWILLLEMHSASNKNPMARRGTLDIPLSAAE